jgi:signal transduction histidine kinase
VRHLDQTERVPRPPLLHRISARQLQLVDVAGALLVIFAILRTSYGPAAGNHGSAVLVVALDVGLSIILRRWAPLTALALMTLAIAVAIVSGATASAAPFIAIPMYQVASAYPRRRSLPSLAVTMVVLLASAAIHTNSLNQGGDATLGLVIAVAAWFVGDSVRARRSYIEGLAEQAAQRQRETLERAQRSVAEERLQIARDLHDVVAHSLSVIAVQSGVGRHVIDDQPEEAKKALAAVEMTSRAALDELRRMLGVLRRDDHVPAALTPAPGMGALGPLIDQVRSAGYDVGLEVRSTAVGAVSPNVELSIYRIVQEALTNVVKHAGPATVRVEIRDEPGAIVLEVCDNGRGPSHLSSVPPGANGVATHHGIVGMRERVALYDGSLWAGARPEGGFRVLARFPLEHLAAS